MSLTLFSHILLHNVDPAWTRAEQHAARRDVARLAAALEERGYPVRPVEVGRANLRALLRNFDPRRHLVLNWCEELPGRAHSEGQAARLLDALGFAYTGSPPEVLDFSEDKAGVKERLRAAGIPTPRGMVIAAPGKKEWPVYPALVKAAREHGSAGISHASVVFSQAELDRQAAGMAARSLLPLMVEEFIDGREFHATIWGDAELEMLPPAEIDFSACADVRDRLCTYDFKFRPRSAHFRKLRRVSCALPPAAAADLGAVCRSAYRAVGCRDYARLDVRLRGGVFYVLDVNPNPDISPDCCLAWSAAQAGFSYGAMAGRLLALAARRHPDYGRHPPRTALLAAGGGRPEIIMV